MPTLHQTHVEMMEQLGQSVFNELVEGVYCPTVIFSWYGPLIILKLEEEETNVADSSSA